MLWVILGMTTFLGMVVMYILTNITLFVFDKLWERGIERIGTLLDKESTKDD